MVQGHPDIPEQTGLQMPFESELETFQHFTPLHAQELEKYSFPVEGVTDQEVVDALKIQQPLKSITLKAPQLLVYAFGRTHPRFIMSFDKGMGKTIAYLATLYMMRPEKLVIVCSENAKPAQRREIVRHLHMWFDKWVFVKGDRAKRQSIWNDPNCDIFICTYDTLAADMGHSAKSKGRICPPWVDTCPLAFDEWHKKLRNKTSGIFKMLKGMKNSRMIFSSGSAGGSGVHSMWAVLHLCDKVKFSSYWKYVHKWSNIEETYFGKKYYGCRNIQAWRREVAPYVFHRRKDLKDYPPKTRQALEVEMEPWQKKLHNEMVKEFLAFLPDGSLFAAPNVLAATAKVRQMLICPKVIHPDLGWGAGLEGIWADIEEGELTHWVISVPYKDPIPWIEQFFLTKKLNGQPVRCETLTGGQDLDADEIERRIARWTKNGGGMIQTIQYAESYELPAARVMYMLSYLHNHEQNMQAEDRIHRDIRVTPWPVDIYYVKNMGSYDEKVIDALAEEADNIHAMMHAPLTAYIQEDI